MKRWRMLSLENRGEHVCRKKVEERLRRLRSRSKGQQAEAVKEVPTAHLNTMVARTGGSRSIALLSIQAI